jgi:hypothetical protein
LVVEEVFVAVIGELELTSLVAPSGGGVPTWCERALEEAGCC